MVLCNSQSCGAGTERAEEEEMEMEWFYLPALDPQRYRQGITKVPQPRAGYVWQPNYLRGVSAHLRGVVADRRARCCGAEEEEWQTTESEGKRAIERKEAVKPRVVLAVGSTEEQANKCKRKILVGRQKAVEPFKETSQ